MKNLILLIFCLFVGACSSDPCDDINCLNNGFCANGLCNCLDGFEGSDCSIEKEPTSILITSVKIISFPIFDGDQTWDFSSIHPDIYFRFRNTDVGLTSLPSTTIWNAQIGDELVYNSNFSIEPWDSKMIFEIFDNDTDSLTGGADDFMGGITFQATKTPPSLNNTILSIGGIEVELTVEYNY